MRRAIAEHCRDLLDPELVEDLQFVASELVANAYEHGERRGVITVDVLIDGTRAVLTVTSGGNSHNIPHPNEWKMPDVEYASGRGLALTRIMSKCVELHTAVSTDTGDWVAVTAHLAPARSDSVGATVAA